MCVLEGRGEGGLSVCAWEGASLTTQCVCVCVCLRVCVGGGGVARARPMSVYTCLGGVGRECVCVNVRVCSCVHVCQCSAPFVSPIRQLSTSSSSSSTLWDFTFCSVCRFRVQVALRVDRPVGRPDCGMFVCLSLGLRRDKEKSILTAPRCAPEQLNPHTRSDRGTVSIGWFQH